MLPCANDPWTFFYLKTIQKQTPPYYLARAKRSNTGIVPQQQNAIWGRCTNVVITLVLKKQNKTNKQIEEKMFNNSITKRNEIITKKHYKPVRLQTNDSLLSFRLFAE